MRSSFFAAGASSRAAVSAVVLLALAAATAAAGPAGPCPVSAHPDLLARLGKSAVARLVGEQTPDEMYTDMHARRAKAPRGKAVGTGTCLVILWQFTDHPADATGHPSSSYQNLLFSTGTWPTGSMNDYYREVSYGAFGVGGSVSGWTTSSRLYADARYVPHDATHTRTMIADAIAQLDPTVNFALYDNDGPDGVPNSGDDDGYVDALFFVHAGPGQEETGNTNDIWSHAWSFPGGLATGDGVSIGRYSVEPEETAAGALVAIGVYCHEYGHVLGLPDLYDTDYTSSGVGEWCLMGSGSWTARAGQQGGASPAHLSAWCKQELGWVSPMIVTATSLGVSVPPAETNAAAYRIFRNGATTGDEYFLVENRRALGFDRGLTRRQVVNGLPQPEGLLVLHVDEATSSNSNERHRLVDVVEATPWLPTAGGALEHLDVPMAWGADLKLNKGNRGDNGDLWPGFASISADTTNWLAPRSRDRFAADTVPAAVSAYCEPVGFSLENIALSGVDVQVDFLLGVARAPATQLAKEMLAWDFESGAGDWNFCNSFAHVDQTQAAGCSGASGLWFGVNDASFVCPPGYGNGWNDIAWHPVVVTAGAEVTIRHKYALELDYDFATIEVRHAGDYDAAWYPVAQFTGDSGGCLTGTYPIPPAVIAAYADPVSGLAGLDLRLHFTSDEGWSAEDGSYCGLGWWVDELTVGGAVTGAGDLPDAASARQAVLLPASPNPFNPMTRVRFHVPAGARVVHLGVYDQRGRLVRSLVSDAPAAGWLERAWDGKDDTGRQLGSGVYYARLDVDGSVQIQKLALVK